MKNNISKRIFLAAIVLLTVGCTSNFAKPSGQSGEDSAEQLPVEEDAEIEIDDDMGTGGF